MKTQANTAQTQKIFLASMIAIGLLLSTYAYASEGQEKVTVCHKGKHEITIGEPAVSAHLNHGDTIGACDDGGGGPSPA